jgi:hypothetical protein
MESPDGAQDKTGKRVSIEVTNYSTKTLWLSMEMEGDGLSLGPNESCTAVLISRDRKPLELDKLGLEFVINDDEIVQLYTACDVELWQGGRMVKRLY